MAAPHHPDLGLPDHYDTAGGANSTAFWTLMSAGSWLGRSESGIGELPGDLTAWAKMQLGRLAHDTAKAGTPSTHELGVAEYDTDRKQALVNTYYDETNPTGGVKITDTNTRIEILDEAEDGSSVSLQVGPSVTQVLRRLPCWFRQGRRRTAASASADQEEHRRCP